MENKTANQSEELFAAKKAYREQLAKKGEEGYDQVLTVLLQKEMNRLKRRERMTITKAERSEEV
jgi:hypothetical protein